MNKSKLLLVSAIAIAVGAFFALGLDRYLTLASLKTQQHLMTGYVANHPLASALTYFVLYVLVTALSLPGAALMTLVGGAIFGLGWGTLIVSFASSIGATLAFLVARFLLRDAVQRRFGRNLAALNRGIEHDGPLYLFTLRLVPVFPFFVINLLMGLTPLRTRTFYWVSQLGMLPGTLVYVNAGTQLSQLHSLHGILSPALLLSFALLGLFPLAAHKTTDFIRARQALRRWPKPRRFDRNLVVIGAGATGLVSAYIAATVRAKVSLIERHKMGGDCLNTGCVPSKALLRSAQLLADIRQARNVGLKSASAQLDFAEVMERVRRVIRRIEPHDSAERYRALGVDCIEGEARITSPYTVAVNGQTLTTRSIVIAAGARPLIPPIPGLAEIGYVTSDTLWDLRELPARLLVLGGGPIGCELAQAFARLGSRVTQLEMLPRLLPREDEEFSTLLAERFAAEGIDVRTDHKASAFRIEQGTRLVECDHRGSTVRIPFDLVLVALGRIANTSGYGLEELGIPVEQTIVTNAFLQTIYPNIYAAGDVAGPYQFTHVGAHQAWFATVNALFGRFRKFRADYSAIPWATFTDPEVARVGLNEQEASAQGIAYEVTRYRLDELDRAIVDGADYGMVKVLTVPGRDRILGVTIAAKHAGELIAEYTLAMRHRLGLNKILSTIHIYPTLSEANKYAAGEWKKAHAPETVLRWLARYHAWQRSATITPWW